MCSIDYFVPRQYVCRAEEAVKIRSIPADTCTKVVGKRIALAELGQVIIFLVQAIFYTLCYFGFVTPTVAGIVACITIPVEALCSYQTFVHYKAFSRLILTAAAIFTLSSCAGFAFFGIVKDSAITLCAGGVALHIFRNISEWIDTRKSLQDRSYRKEILHEPSKSKLSSPQTS